MARGKEGTVKEWWFLHTGMTRCQSKWRSWHWRDDRSVLPTRKEPKPENKYLPQDTVWLVHDVLIPPPQSASQGSPPTPATSPQTQPTRPPRPPDGPHSSSRPP